MKTLSTLCLGLVLTAAAPAQLATYQIVGKSCTTGRLTKSLGPVPLSAKGVPSIGKRFAVVTEGSANYPWGNMRRVSLATGLKTLAFDIGPLFPKLAFCGVLRTSMEVIQPVPRTLDYKVPVEVWFTVPNQASLIGVKFYQQAISSEFSTFGGPNSRRALALSAGGVGTIGR